MTHGGKRPGAGRPNGSLNKRSQEIVAKAASEGITPLEVMLKAMRQHVDAGDLGAAAEIAKDAAPYIHPRLANSVVTHKDAFAELTLEQLSALAALADGHDAAGRWEAGQAGDSAEAGGKPH